MIKKTFHLFVILTLPLLSNPNLEEAMQKARTEAKIPAIAAVSFDSEKVLQSKIIGSTRSDKDISIPKNATWHIGSDAKAMTATLVAILVEKDLLTWESTMAELFPKLGEKFHPAAQKITITQLLSHTAGLPANPEPLDRLKSRLAVTKIGLASKPDKGFLYSNYGYIIAGAVIEELLNTTWEKAIQKHLFKPLGIKSVGFGAPKGRKAIHGHRDGKPAGTGFLGDNPPLYGPAGGLHLTLPDWTLFCQDQIKGHHGKGKLLKQATYQKLHNPVQDNYALGWGTKSEDGKVTHLRHDGSNTMWRARANLNLSTQRGYCIIINTNEDEAVDQISKIADVLTEAAE